MITSPVPKTSQAIIRYPPFVIPTEAEGSAVLQFHPTSIAFKRKVRFLLRLRLKGCPNPLPSASPHSTQPGVYLVLSRGRLLPWSPCSSILLKQLVKAP